MNNPPRFSVIVAAYNAERTIRASLAALGAQLAPDVEVIVVDSSTDRTPQIVSAVFPFATLVRSTNRLPPGAARNLGLRAARGDIIAFVDSDCVARPDWLATLRRAHAEEAAAAIGGAVTPANPGSLIGWAAYFCEFSAWMPAGPRRPMRDIPTCNLSYQRWALERFGPFRESSYSSDTALNWRLAAGGLSLLFLPELQVAHFNLTDLRTFLSKQVMHGRAFARMRCAEQSLSRATRAALAAGCLALPAILLARISGRVARTDVRARFTRALPAVLAGLAAWSLGEALGYVRGA